MRERIFMGLLSLLLPACVFRQDATDTNIPLAPVHNRRPENYQPISYKYSLEDLKETFSVEMIKEADRQYRIVMEVNDKGKWKATPESIDSHETPEWFKDAKFGMFIDWGLWSVAGWAPKNENKAMYPDWYEFRLDSDSIFMKYHEKNWGKDFRRDDFIPLFTAIDYNPRKLVKIASEAGMKYIVPFCKHHSGFCLWPSSFTKRDAGEMGPGRDLIGPMAESCREEGLKFGFYFSLEEWEYPLINENGDLVNRLWGGKTEPYIEDLEKKSSGKIAVKKFAENYTVPQATEFIDRYDPDILWYDGEWSTSVYDLHSYDISAYFYNRAEGRKEVAVNDRYGVEKDDKWLRFRRGDFYTSEFHDHTDVAKTHTWEECRGISQSFGYNWQDTEGNVISSKSFIDMFVDIVANGGNLLLIVNLDGQGALPVIEEERLKDIGTWLKINGEGIYGTRSHSPVSEGSVVFTAGKDQEYVYAIMKEWPGKVLDLKSLSAEKGSVITLLGYEEPLEWITRGEGIEIRLPDKLQDKSYRPCDYAWVLKIKVN